MPQQLTSAQLQQYINVVNSGGVAAAKEVYQQMLTKGFNYAGWANGVAAGNSITGREAFDFLANSALMGVGSQACRNLTTAQIDKIKVDMAAAYLGTLLRDANENGGMIDRDVRYRETEQFHMDVFTKNGLSIDNWTLKIPMDLLRGSLGEAGLEKRWQEIRDTQGTGFDALVQSSSLAAVVVDRAWQSPDPAIREKAQKWLDTVMGPSFTEKLQKLMGDFLKSEVQDRLTNFENGGYSDWNGDSDFERERVQAISTIRDSRLAAENIFKTVISPLVLDLDGDGVETISINRNVHFDHDGNGFSETTGWVGSDDGLLVYDRNGNGNVDNGGELFGSYTKLQDGSNAANGFIALEEFDSNHDSKINAQDGIFLSLRVWRDLNQDGFSQADELFTLQNVGVAALSTQYATSNKVDSQGNERRQIGEYTRADGSKAQMHDVWLERNSGSAFSNGQDGPDPVEVLGLPEIDGFGSLLDLRDAMSSDLTLRGYVEEFVAQSSVTRREQLIDLIVMRWTGADRVVFAIDSPYYDERKLFAIDVASGEAVYDRNYNVRPNAGPQASPYIDQGYATLRSYVGTKLERQVTLFLRDQLELRTDAQGDLYFELKDYAQLRSSNPQQALGMLVRLVQGSGQQLLELGWNGYEMLRQEIAYFASVPGMATFMRDAMNIAQGTGTIQPANYAAPAVLLGSSGNDRVNGGERSIYFGDGGDDYISLQSASTIVFGVGSGHDRVSEDGRAKSILFDASVLPGDVSVSTKEQDLVFTLVSGETLTIVGWSYGASRSDAETSVSQVAFEKGGTVWSLAEISDRFRMSDGINDFHGTYLPEYVNGKAGNDYLSGGAGSDFIVGGAGDDWIYGGDGNNLLFGGDGNDRLDAYGRQSHDFLVGGTGNDFLSGDSGGDTYFFEVGFGSDKLTDFDESSPSTDVVIFGPGLRLADIVVFREANDISITFKGGSDRLTIQNWFDKQAPSRIERFLFDDGTLLSADQLLAKVTYPSTEGNDSLLALDQGSTIYGAGGDDYLRGGLGIDILYGDSGNDVIEANGDADTLVGGAGNDTLYGRDGADSYVFAAGDGTDIIYETYETGVTDTLTLGFRPDQVSLRRGGYNSSSLMIDIVGGAQGIEVYGWLDNDDRNDSLHLRFNEGTVWSADYLWRNSIAPTGTAYRYGTPDADLLVGDALNNVLRGYSGADTLDGGIGNDSLYGGYGDDTYVFRRGMGQDTAGDDGGIDSVRFESGIESSDITITRDLSFTTISLNSSSDRMLLTGASGIEFLKFANGSSIDLMASTTGPLIGNNSANALNGSEQNDRLEGLAGNDTLNGNGGDDILLGGEGQDKLTGGSGADTLEGGKDDDFIWMDSRDTVVFGRGDGADTIYRGYDDTGTIRFGAGIVPSDIVLKAGNERTLQVGISNTTDSLNLAYWFNPEHPDSTLRNFEFSDGTRWTLADIRARIPATGTSGDDVIYGSEGAETLTGGPGSDQIYGWSGNDVLQGGDGNDYLSAGSGADTLTGGTGSDRLYGFDGDDAYLFDRGFGEDTIYEGGAPDTKSANRLVFGNGIAPSEVIVTGDNQFTPGSEGNLYLSVLGTSDKITLSQWFGTYAPNIDFVQFSDGTTWDRTQLLKKFYALERGGLMYGSDAGDQLTGDDGPDTLEGMAGNDTLTGAGGNDEIFGDEGNDLLSGGGGNDLLFGGIGDDTYFYQRGDGVDRIADFDRVTASNDKLVFGFGITPTDVIVKREDDHMVLYVSGSTNGNLDAVAIRWFGSEALRIETVVFADGQTWSAAQLEEMALNYGEINGTEAADLLTGTAGADKIFGRGGDDTLDGRAGADTMVGGAGNDSYFVDSVNDVVNEIAGGGWDGVWSTVNLTLSDNVEGLHLIEGSAATIGTGNALDNYIEGTTGADELYGLDGDDMLNGNVGNDTMVGGIGNDIYLVSDIADVVVELASQGNDSVRLYSNDPAVFYFTLPDNVENLDASGDSLNHYLGGNALGNFITAGVGDDALNGLEGNDTMAGGKGNDTYFVSDDGDVLIEAVGEGTDTVLLYPFSWTFQTYSLPENVENVDASGHWNTMSLVGNGLNNGLIGSNQSDTLAGGAGADTLTGNAGNDSLDGGLGADTLAGGMGNDTYVLGRGYGVDLIQENDGTAGNTDVLQLMSGVSQDQLWFRKLGNSLEVSIIGTPDSATVQDWYLGSQYHVEQFKTSNGKTLLDSKVQSLVDAMASFAPPAVGQTTLPTNYQTTLAPVIAANWGP